MLPNPFDDQRPRAKAKAGWTFVGLAAFNVAAWGWAWLAFGEQPALLAIALLAYAFGLRHAFDADHIAAIDNVVRKLMAEGKTPLSAGFFFSLGHSTVVLVASVAIAATAAAMQARLLAFHAVGTLVGTVVSAAFLLVIGIANLFTLRGIATAFARARRGERVLDEELDTVLAGRGLLARLFRPLFRIVSRSLHMYPIGLLFGLGFDTATEIGLLGISATQAAQGLSFWTILVFPTLFTAGMSLMDTADSTLMTGAYGWAVVNPVRKLWYNLTITAASVAVALFMGGIEVLGVIGDQWRLQGVFWRAVGDLNANLANLGFAVVGLFVASWLVSMAIYRVRPVEGVEAGGA